MSIVYGGKEVQTVRELTGTFRYFEPNLYMKEWKQWNSWLGQMSGRSLRFLIEFYNEEGAVPRDLEIAH